MKGRIAAFNDQRGDGLVRSDDGHDFYFHCVSIADGSRSVGVGETVTARRGVGHLGHDEAFEIVKDART
jgi:cold shock CspA family protein